jgi:hypothetical protein
MEKGGVEKSGCRFPETFEPEAGCRRPNPVSPHWDYDQRL